jgi:flagellar motor switch protein FliM
MTNDSPGTPTPAPLKVVRPAYDAVAPDLLPVDQVAFVETIHNHFLTALSQSLAAYLDTPCTATPAGIDQTPAAAFLESAEKDACLLTLQLTPIKGNSWITLGQGLVFRVLDILLGARPGATTGARAGITDIERHVLRELFELLMGALNTSWSPTGLGFHIDPAGSTGDVPAAAESDGATMILKCNVRLGEAEELFRVAVPVLSVRLAILQSEEAAGLSPAQSPAHADLLDAVSSASLQLEAVLGGSSLRMSDLAAMQPGQVLVLGQPAGSPLDCLVNGKAKFRGEWITQGDRPAFQVDALVESAGPRRSQPV